MDRDNRSFGKRVLLQCEPVANFDFRSKGLGAAHLTADDLPWHRSDNSYSKITIATVVVI